LHYLTLIPTGGTVVSRAEATIIRAKAPMPLINRLPAPTPSAPLLPDPLLKTPASVKPLEPAVREGIKKLQVL
jgi:hypothetical protein